LAWYNPNWQFEAGEQVSTLIDKLISSHIENSVLMIEFEDSSSRNSFSLRAAEEFRSAWADTKGQYKSIVFFARGRVFCSGGNLADYGALSSAEEGHRINRRITEILTEFSELEVPTICVVSGDCFGGGIELVSAFDFVLSVPHVMYGLWQRRIGLTFGWGGGSRLEARLGRQRLKNMALSAGTFSAFDARSVGLVDEICVESKINNRAVEIARRLNALPQGPISEIKQICADSENQKNLEQGSFERLWWSPEHRAAIEQQLPIKDRSTKS
jgi:enoyl-CoA hydratase/carnithine racemase